MLVKKFKIIYIILNHLNQIYLTLNKYIYFFIFFILLFFYTLFIIFIIFSLITSFVFHHKQSEHSYFSHLTFTIYFSFIVGIIKMYFSGVCLCVSISKDRAECWRKLVNGCQKRQEKLEHVNHKSKLRIRDCILTRFF